MSAIDGKVARLVQFYRSGPLPCPYLPGRIERKLFARLVPTSAAAMNSILSQAGFRRSHDIVYRPVCSGCRACVPVRIPVAAFRPDRSMRRTLKRNADLVVVDRPAIPTGEQFALFSAYQRSRHADGDMARMTRTDYDGMVVDGGQSARIIEARDLSGRLVAVMLVDLLEDGYSAVYSFFDPEIPDRGLGTFLILTLADVAARAGLPHVYLGYWVDGSAKMAYKTRFQPLEALVDGRWRVQPRR